MANDTITLGLGGDVPFGSFVEGMRQFHALVDALTEELGVGKTVTWSIHSLEYGSTSTTIKGEAKDIADVERVVDAYATVGKSLETHSPIPYSPGIVNTTISLAKLLANGVSYVRFETLEGDSTLYEQIDGGQPQQRPLVAAVGAVEGRIQTLTDRRDLRFTLYDHLHDKAVSCYITESQRELVRNAWGNRAIVAGRVTRDRQTGRPFTIREIRFVDILPVERTADYRKARGALLHVHGDPMPEDIIRRLRDAE